MSEKLTAARMNDGESSLTERMIAGAANSHAKQTLCDALTHFPSYLHLFDKFFGLLFSESQWRAPRLSGGYPLPLPMEKVHVAFL